MWSRLTSWIQTMQSQRRPAQPPLSLYTTRTLQPNLAYPPVTGVVGALSAPPALLPGHKLCPAVAATAAAGGVCRRQAPPRRFRDTTAVSETSTAGPPPARNSVSCRNASVCAVLIFCQKIKKPRVSDSQRAAWRRAMRCGTSAKAWEYMIERFGGRGRREGEVRI